MSRRISLFALAASAALIATQALADPECFGDTCHLPEVVEPPAVVQTPMPEETTASEASAAAQLPAKALPRATLPQAALPQAPLQASAEPAARQPLRPAQNFADETSARPEPKRLAPRMAREAAAPLPAADPMPAGYARAVRVSSPDPSYNVGLTAAPVGGIVVVVPGALYAGRTPLYIAPSAKIISIDSDD